MATHLPRHLVPSIPKIRLASLPLEERESADFISVLLAELVSYSYDFWAALNLFDYASTKLPGVQDMDIEQKQLFTRWLLIAAKDGAMTIYHFGETLDLIRGGLKDCPTLRELTHIDDLKSADKDFDKLFPNYVRLRHAIAHEAVVAKTPREKYIDTDNEAVFITATVDHRTFKAHWNGRDAEYDISSETLDNLNTMIDRVMRAFSRALRHPLEVEGS